VADDVGHANASGAVEDGDSAVAWIPRLDRHPGMEFSIVVHQLAITVDHETRIPRHAERVLFHD
jgi:hypothetical protein